MVTRIEQMFGAYNATWADRERGSSIASLPDFGRLYSSLVASGLAERIETFADRMNSWASEDLIPLHNALTSELAAIETRLTPINAVLARFPFGDQGHVLQLVMQRIPDEDFAAWRGKLGRVIGGATGDSDWVGLQARYAEIKDVIGPLRHPRSGGSEAQRDRYLDIKRRIRIIADEYDGAARVGTIANLSTFSGGESQELSAVMQVAALRYALGDSTRPKPRFGAIMMDEAFIKADREFTERSMTTLQNLGFQTIVAGPLQSMNAVQDFVTTFAFVDKDRHSRISGVVMATAEDVRAGRPRRRPVTGAPTDGASR